MPLVLIAPLTVALRASTEERNQQYVARILPLIESLEATGANVSVFCTGSLLEHLLTEQPDAIERLRTLGDQIDWLAGSMYGAGLGPLSERDRQEHLERTQALLQKLFSVSPTGVWLGYDWDRSLPATLIRAGYRFAVVEDRQPLESPLSAGTAMWQGRTLAILPVQNNAQEHGFHSFGWSQAPTNPDESMLQRPDLQSATEAYRNLPVPTPRKQLESLVGSQLDTAHLSRRLRKASATARTHLLKAQSTLNREEDILYVAEETIRAQMAFDAAQHRTRGWCDLERLDWAGELLSDLRVELPDQSWVLDPHRGSLRYFDEKPSVWPVSTQRLSPVSGQGQWLADRWEGDDDQPGHFELVSHETQRGSITAVLRRPGLEKTIQASDRRISVHYEFDGLSYERFGPEFTVQSFSLMLRIDGGAWRTPSSGEMLPGHRFRLREESRSTELTIDLPVPGYLGVEDESTGSGEYRFWPHFIASGATTYDVSFTFSDVIESATDTTD